MPYGLNGTDLLQQIEWVPGNQKTHHKIASSGYKINGQTLAAAGKAPVTLPSVSSSYLYKGERLAAGAEGTSGGVARIWGYGLNGARDETQFTLFQKVGCRPRLQTQLYHQANAGTYYINRFTDGEVWVSTTANSKTGTKISNSIASMVYPRGVCYIMIRLIGGGGNGSKGTALPAERGSGGGGGATGVCCIRLPENGNAKIVVGGAGQASSVTCGTFLATAGGGGNGSGNDGASGGSYTTPNISFGEGVTIATANGGSGGGAGNAGGNSSISFTDYAPEGGAVAWSQSGGSSGSGKAGGGGASTIGAGGAVANNSLNTNGSMGSGPGAGGSGGNYSNGSGASGQPGAVTIWY